MLPAMQSPLATPRLSLRPLEAADFEDFHALWNDPRVIWWKAPESVEAAREPYARLLERNAGWPDGIGWLGVFERTGGGLVGDVVLQPAPFVEGIEVGWHFREHVWGRGYATEAARAVVARAFADGVLHGVYAAVALKNAPSRRVAEKLGMRSLRRFERVGLEHDLFHLARSDPPVGG